MYFNILAGIHCHLITSILWDSLEAATLTHKFYKKKFIKSETLQNMKHSVTKNYNVLPNNTHASHSVPTSRDRQHLFIYLGYLFVFGGYVHHVVGFHTDDISCWRETDGYLMVLFQGTWHNKLWRGFSSEFSHCEKKKRNEKTGKNGI